MTADAFDQLALIAEISATFLGFIAVFLILSGKALAMTLVLLKVYSPAEAAANQAARATSDLIRLPNSRSALTRS